MYYLKLMPHIIVIHVDVSNPLILTSNHHKTTPGEDVKSAGDDTFKTTPDEPEVYAFFEL